MSAAIETTPAQTFAGQTEPPLHVERVRRLDRAEFDGDFRVEAWRHYLDDGSRYDVQRFLPNRPLFTIKATYTTPWVTDLDGFNKRIGSALAVAGMETIAVSPERLRVGQLPSRLGRLSLLHDVQAHHAILDHFDERERGTAGPKEVISVGYSRGAMIGFGLNATSVAQKRDVRYSDYIDPCLEHQVRLRDIDWLEVPQYLGEELLALGQGLQHYTFAELLGLAQGAVRPSVCFWLQQAALAKTLFSGETGRFVDGWHADSVARVNLYTRSRFNHATNWRRRFANMRNVDIVSEPGLHLSGVDPRVLKGMVGRVLLAQELMKDNYTPDELHTQLAQWQPEPPKRKPVILPHLPKLRTA